MYANFDTLPVSYTLDHTYKCMLLPLGVYNLINVIRVHALDISAIQGQKCMLMCTCIVFPKLNTSYDPRCYEWCMICTWLQCNPLMADMRSPTNWCL